MTKTLAAKSIFALKNLSNASGRGARRGSESESLCFTGRVPSTHSSNVVFAEGVGASRDRAALGSFVVFHVLIVADYTSVVKYKAPSDQRFLKRRRM